MWGGVANLLVMCAHRSKGVKVAGGQLATFESVRIAFGTTIVMKTKGLSKDASCVFGGEADCQSASATYVQNSRASCVPSGGRLAIGRRLATRPTSDPFTCAAGAV